MTRTARGSTGGASLGDFRPTADTIIDLDHPTLNGVDLPVERDAATGRHSVALRFDHFYIPRGVTVHFRGFDFVELEVADDTQIDGTLDASGGNGADGGPGLVNVSESGDALPPIFFSYDASGSGGNGGVGSSGQGAGGYGEYYWGQDGAGPTSPGQPIDPMSTMGCGIYPPNGGIGGSGGGNGTNGALADPHWDCDLGGLAFGSPDFSVLTEPAGGGGRPWGSLVVGAAGTCIVWETDPSNWGGPGYPGGSGGGGGAIFIYSADDLVVSGTISANGGNGGNGGGGGWYTVPGVTCDTPGTVYASAGAGGGGGGAGGFIRLGSGTQVIVTGTVQAAGGVGGLGGPAGQGIAPPYLGPNADLNGYPGGAGGGGRVEAFAPLAVSGLAVSTGTDAFGSSTPGNASVYLGPRVASISFNLNSGAAPGGLNLAIDSNTPQVPVPEWQVDNNDKVPTAQPYDTSTSAPAAFVVNQPLTLQATFTASNAVLSAVIGASITLADGTPSPYGNLPAQTITFADGQSVLPVTYVSTQASNTLGASDQLIQWEAESITTGSGTDNSTLEMRTSVHRIYTILRIPTAPMAVPWAKVLEISSGLLDGTAVDSIGQTPSDQTVVQTVANGIFYSLWTGLDTRFFQPTGAYEYDPTKCLAFQCHTGDIGAYPLQSFLDQISSKPVLMQCSDNADLLTILAASHGIVAPPTRIQNSTGPLQTNPYYGAGQGADGNPPQCAVNLFMYHVVGTSTNLFDCSVQCPIETDSGNCNSATVACTPGQNFFDLDRPTYLPLVFANQAVANTVFSTYPITIAACTQ